MAEQAYVIGRYQLRPGRELLADGVQVPLGAKALELLSTLVAASGALVTKEELLARVWPGLIVEEHNIQVQISALRKALGPDANWIVTVPRRGYRFAGEAAAKGDASANSPRGHDLPRPPTRLLGRETDVSAVMDALTQNGLVTIAGPGGVGKTRLALEIAHWLLPSYRDGVYLVDLAVLGDPRLVPSAVATALGIPLRSDAPPLDLVVRRIRTQTLLIVLDNCEHVIDAAAELAEALLTAAPSIRLLATSREALACPGEQVYRLLPLALPSEGVTRAGTALEASAVALLVDRVRGAESRFALTDEDADAAGMICRRLDGLPLAIEMVSAWVPTFGLAGLVARLDASFSPPEGGRRIAQKRHRSLEAALDWSHDLLAEPEQRVLRRLAVFAGFFSLEAAEAVLADVPGIAALLAGLVRKSLITATPGATYRMLETTRAYAMEKLDAAGEVAAVRRQHARYVADRLERANLEWDITSDPVWDGRYRPLIDDLRAALGWTMAVPAERNLALTLVGRSMQLWASTGLDTEGSRHAEAASALLTPATPVAIQAAVWCTLGGLVGSRFPERCIEVLERAAALFGEAGDPLGRGHALIGAGQTLALYGGSARAGPILEEARLLLAQGAGPRRLGLCAIGFGMLHAAEGRWDAVRREYETASTMARSVGAERLLALTLYNLADAIWIERDLEAAEAASRRALAQARRVGGIGLIGGSAGILAGVLIDRGALDEALVIAREALPLCREDDYLAWLYDHLALRAAKLGRLQDAARLSGHATRLHDGSPRQVNEQRAVDQLAEILGRSIGAAEFERLAALGALLTEEQAGTLALDRSSAPEIVGAFVVPAATE